MQKSNITAQQGNIFESENTVVNQPLFAVTKGNIGTAAPWTGSQVAEALADPKLHNVVKEVRAETDEQKQKALKEQRKFDIIGICPHFWQFKGNHRAAAEALAECCTYKTCIDVDDRQYGQQAIDGALRLNEQPGMWRDKVLYIENSLRGGGKCHIWLICPVGMTAIETQQAFCKALDIPCDDAVQQKQSFILMTGDAVYQSPRWLQPLSQEEIEARQTAFRLRGLSIDGWDKASGNTATATSQPVEDKLADLPADSDITAPTPRTNYIFETFWRQTNLDPASLSTDGKCHNSLKSLLSTGIVQLLTKSEMQGQLRQRTPDYWQCSDCQNLIRDFYSKYNDPSRALTQFQRHVLAVHNSSVTSWPSVSA